MYRILRAEGQLEHRERSKPRTHHRPTPHMATAPDQLWSWDITYLKSCIRGCFYYLYMVEDVWSRKIVAWEVHETEDARLAAELVRSSCELAGIDPQGLVLHSDNGGPMKGSTMLATLQRLGIVPSFSRPSVSDDNPYSESLFRTMKYRPAYPTRPFESLAHARAWVAAFVAWYNTEHLHSGVGFVTPADRHAGRDQEDLQAPEAGLRPGPQAPSGAMEPRDPGLGLDAGGASQSREDGNAGRRGPGPPVCRLMNILWATTTLTLTGSAKCRWTRRPSGTPRTFACHQGYLAWQPSHPQRELAGTGALGRDVAAAHSRRLRA